MFILQVFKFIITSVAAELQCCCGFMVGCSIFLHEEPGNKFNKMQYNSTLFINGDCMPQSTSQIDKRTKPKQSIKTLSLL